MGEHADSASDGFSLKADGKQDQGSAKVTAVSCIPLPEQKAQSQVKRVGAAFLQGGLRLPVNLHETLVDIGF